MRIGFFMNYCSGEVFSELEILYYTPFYLMTNLHKKKKSGSDFFLMEVCELAFNAGIP